VLRDQERQSRSGPDRVRRVGVARRESHCAPEKLQQTFLRADRLANRRVDLAHSGRTKPPVQGVAEVAPAAMTPLLIESSSESIARASPRVNGQFVDAQERRSPLPSSRPTFGWEKPFRRMPAREGSVTRANPESNAPRGSGPNQSCSRVRERCRRLADHDHDVSEVAPTTWLTGRDIHSSHGCGRAQSPISTSRDAVETESGAFERSAPSR